MGFSGINPVYLILGLAILGLAPFMLMLVTSYVKIVVVTSLIRNALGVQQIPPAMVMNGLAITAGSKPSRFATRGNVHPIIFAITTVRPSVMLTTRAT